VLYGLGIVGGTVELAVALLTAPNEAELPPADALGSLALVPGPAMVTLLAYAAFPIAAYLLGLAACLGLELLRTLLGIPAILEKLSPRDAEGGERD
jgi:uncharacterized membrane protein YraQ (UPF0718 family)